MAPAPAQLPPLQAAAPAVPSGTQQGMQQQGGWRGRSTSFLLGNSSLTPAASAAPAHKQQAAQHPLHERSSGRGRTRRQRPPPAAGPRRLPHLHLHRPLLLPLNLAQHHCRQ